MAFSEQVQQLCAGMSAEQAVSLRAFIVHLTERTEANPGVLNTGLRSLMQEATDEGFDAANLLATVKQLTKAAVPVEDQARFAAELEKHLAGNASISEIAALISSSYPGWKAKMLELVDAAIAETRSLTSVAGGTSHKGDFKKTWQKTPNSTKKQKWEKGGIDALEVFAGLSLINYGYFTLKEKIGGGRAIKIKGGSDTGFLEMDNAFMKGEVRHRKILGMVVTDRKFDHWFGKGGRLNFEINRFTPGGVYRAGRQLAAEERDLLRHPSHESFRSSVISDFESHESELESLAEKVDLPRLERELARNAQFDNLYRSVRNELNPSVKKHPDLRRAWSTHVRPEHPSFDLGKLESKLVSDAKLLGADAEQVVKDDITDIVEAEKNIIKDK